MNQDEIIKQKNAEILSLKKKILDYQELPVRTQYSDLLRENKELHKYIQKLHNEQSN
jgi:hypothetical protein